MSIQERAAEQLAEKRRAKKPGPVARSGWVPKKVWAGQPLKAWQLRDLSILAKTAWERLREAGAIEPPVGLAVTTWFKQWKHAEQARAVGRGSPEGMTAGISLCDCSQGDFRSLELHFKQLGGVLRSRDFERALRSEDKDEGVRQRLKRLDELLESRSLTREYALSVARPWFKVSALEELEPRQVTDLMGRLRKRGGRSGK